jgi:hypothetical protein
MTFEWNQWENRKTKKDQQIEVAKYSKGSGSISPVDVG